TTLFRSKKIPGAGARRGSWSGSNRCATARRSSTQPHGAKRESGPERHAECCQRGLRTGEAGGSSPALVRRQGRAAVPANAERPARQRGPAWAVPPVSCEVQARAQAHGVLRCLGRRARQPARGRDLARASRRRFAPAGTGAGPRGGPVVSFARLPGGLCVRYRPARRHLVRFEPPSRGNVAPVFAKLSPPRDSARAFRVSTALHHWLASERTSVTCPRPLAFSAADSAVLYPEVAGLPLVERLRRPSQDAMQWVRRAGEALSVLHRAPQSVTEGLALHDVSSELDVIE